MRCRFFWPSAVARTASWSPTASLVSPGSGPPMPPSAKLRNQGVVSCRRASESRNAFSASGVVAPGTGV